MKIIDSTGRIMSRVNGVVGRRDLLKLLGVGGAGIAATTASGVLWRAGQVQAGEPLTVAADTENFKPVSPDDALKRLMDGNRRFAQQKPMYPDQTLARLQLVAKGQRPFAAILSCSDSRVPAEIVFDQGLGDLFMIRVAGNVLTDEGIGSLEYATAVLGAQLIMILGHRRCGAVTAAIEGEPLPGRIGTFVESIKPAVARAKSQSGDPLDNTIIANVKYQVERLKETSTLLDQLIQQGKLKIVGGRYNLDNGEVTLVS